jgi:predicted amino acid dehydrogenase
MNRFAFVIHPIQIQDIHRHPRFHWTRYLPDAWLEPIAALVPPLYISRITGIESPTTSQSTEGYLLSLGATPKQMMKHKTQFTYQRLKWAAHLAQKKGASILGLGAFTSVIGDAGVTVARQADIAITSGNSLTAMVTIETARDAISRMITENPAPITAMVIGATGSIGSLCARLLAKEIRNLVLVSLNRDRLESLKIIIESESPGTTIQLSTLPDTHIVNCQLIITATSSIRKQIFHISSCQPGSVICDVAKPPDVQKLEAEMRPDILVVEIKNVIMPGDIRIGYDIGLPPAVVYPCLAETALLALDGCSQDFSIGRNISLERTWEIFRLFKKHQFRLDTLRSFGENISNEVIAAKKVLAESYRNDHKLLRQIKSKQHNLL